MEKVVSVGEDNCVTIIHDVCKNVIVRVGSVKPTKYMKSFTPQYGSFSDFAEADV